MNYVKMKKYFPKTLDRHGIKKSSRNDLAHFYRRTCNLSALALITDFVY